MRPSCIRNLLACFIAVLLFLLAVTAQAQVANKTGSIYGKIIDDRGADLPGVSVRLESNAAPPQTATSGVSGGFRFANLPPGTYSVDFQLQGFAELRQEDMEIVTGREVQLAITLKPSLAEELTVNGQTPIVDTKQTGQQQGFTRESLDQVPNARDPWVIINQAPGVDTDAAYTQSGAQAVFVSRGDSLSNNIWNYDGIEITDPVALGTSPTYFDFDSFEELSISSAGNDVSIKTGGVAVNIVTKRGSNAWSANASYYFAGGSLQSDNTPDELKAAGVEKSNRLDNIKDFGVDIGGPIIRDKLFVWGALHRNDIGVIPLSGERDFTRLDDTNFKANYTWSPAHDSQFGYFLSNKIKHGRPYTLSKYQGPKTLWDQNNSDTILHGVWTGQHTWIPNDHSIVTARYGYIGEGFSLTPAGGKDVPMIYLAQIPHYEDTFVYNNPMDRPTHDLTVDANLYKEKLLGGDHEFKFGFEYRTAEIHTFSSAGNGVYIADYYQTVPYGPLIGGAIYAQHAVDRRVKEPRQTVYASDTFRRNRLTINAGLRYDRQTGTNQGSTIPGVPGFPEVGAFTFPGNDPGIVFNDWSPRIGGTYDITGDGKTIVRANYARYYDTWNTWESAFNPNYVYTGAAYYYQNNDGDRTITPNELVDGPYYFGGWGPGGFDLQGFLSRLRIDPSFKNGVSNEYILGFERQFAEDLSLSVQYTHRNYPYINGVYPDVPLDQLDNLWVPYGTATWNTVLGTFSTPYYRLNPAVTQLVGNHKVLRTISGYDQFYDGVDINARKRMSHNFTLNGSLVLQRQKATYAGIDSYAGHVTAANLPGSTFPWDPGLIPFLNGQPYSATGGGIHPYLNTNWSLKVNGVYELPARFSVGASANYQQGYPYAPWGRVSDPNGITFLGTAQHRILVEDFGSRRYDNTFTMDLQVEKAFRMSQYGKLVLTGTVFNLFNANTVLVRARDLGSVALPMANFNQIGQYLSPRALRLGLRYTF